jgi:hypothetical protein
MPDTIGNISVPEISVSGTPFPLVSDFPHGRAHAPKVVVHRFGGANRKLEQRFYIGDGLTAFTVVRSDLSETELSNLVAFWESCQGGYKPFTYNAPSDDGLSTAAYTCRFAGDTLSFERLEGLVTSVGLTLIGVPTTSPTYTLNSTSTRFPGSSLQTALLSQVQQVIPLIKIQAIDPAYPAIYLSDRRCTIGGQLYQARLLVHDEISQSIGNEADAASFTFGNADEVLTQLAADTDLFRATLEFSLFHVGTGIKLDLWKGQVINWDGEGQPEFKLVCSDALYELTLPYPPDTIGRRCDKLHISSECPNDTVGINSGTPCDKGWDTPAGCRFHEMDNYFGAVIAKPQSVSIKDNGTGMKGFGRNTITSTSLLEDTIYGTVVPEIYTDTPMPVNCKIAIGREEDTFYTALGIVGRGPLGAYGSGHTLDNQPNHGPGNLGLKEVLGEDPNPESFSLYSIAEGYGPERAAGIAWVEIRRADEKGRQLSRLSEHAMKAIVAQGLKGWVWSAPGSRVLVSITNPVWIAVNAHLRQRGLWHASASAQETAFVVDAAINSAGICDDVVAKIIGSGTEKQFRFRGRIDQQKPLRDWLNEILLNCLGFWVNEFGKLKIGIRFNSSVVEAFTESNILLDSLRLNPIAPQFNSITAAFSDEDYEFAGNTVELADDIHIRQLGAARQAQVNLAGASSKSQAARIITTLLREELGGVTATERKRARRGSFKTTVLALNTEVGQVDSLTSPKMPGGSGEFRIQRWTLHSDYSMTLEWKTTTDSMYDMVVGDKPVDVTPSPETIEFFQSPEGMVWAPNAEYPDAGDPMFGEDEGTFDLRQEYATLKDGAKQATLIISGELPISQFPSGVAPAQIISVSEVAGGSLAAGDYFVAVCAKRSDGQFTPPSNVLSINLASGSKSIKLDEIRWPAGTYTGYVLLGAATSDKLMCAQTEVTGALPSSITWAGPVKRSSWTMPNPNFVRIRAKGKKIWHDGVDGVSISGVATGKITCQGLISLGDNWAGRDVSVIADASDGEAALWNFTVSAYNDATGEFTCSPDPAAAGVEAGDVLIIRTKLTAVGSNWVEDAKWQNGHYPTGMAVNGEVGRCLRIISGTGRGQVRHIVSNTATRITVDEDWAPVPDATSRFIVEASGWEYLAEGPAIKTAIQATKVEIRLPCDNMLDQAVLVCCVGIDRFGNESPEDYFSPFRPIWMYGEPPGVRTVTADYTVQRGDRTIMCDATGGNITITLLPTTEMSGLPLTFYRVDASSNVVSIDPDGTDTVNQDPNYELNGEKSVLNITAT